MKNFMSRVRERANVVATSEEGASGIEYALLAAMVAVALAAFVTPISTKVTAAFTTISAAL